MKYTSFHELHNAGVSAQNLNHARVQGMILGLDKNVYVEPGIWTIEWARDFYDYPVTRSN